MKQSKYNYLIEKGAELYCFNGISRNFFKVPANYRSKIEQTLDNADSYKEKLPLFYNLLMDGAFIVENLHDELGKIREIYERATDKSKSFMLVILPTLGCNFRCWYCVQDHKAQMMDVVTIDKVKKHISHILENEDLENFHIEWFGGEPFLGFRNVIEPITEYTKAQCEKYNIRFTNTATTNGFCISETVAKKLKALDFSMFQITLDGDKRHHDKTRVAVGKSSFDTILQNINNICKYTDETGVILRINYDNENLIAENIIAELNDAIPVENRGRIEILLRRVWQVEEVDNAEEKINTLIAELEKSGYKFRNQSDLVLNAVPCYASYKKMRLITPNGNIGKCTAKDNFDTAPLGQLNEDGTISWTNNLPIDEIYAKPLFENSMCLSCKNLPICMGPCPKSIDLNEREKHEIYCKRRANDIKIEDSILMLCDSMN